MALFKMVIVDDEKRIREGLVTTIPWKELGIEVVGAANNGQTGLEVVRKTRPQIILTDIRMPIMDGLEFTRMVRAEMPMVKIIIISGYDEFAYAQEAIKYGVYDYILKPVGAEELYRTVQKLVETMEKDFINDLDMIKLKNALGPTFELYINFIRLGEKEEALAKQDEIIRQLKDSAISLSQMKQIYLELSAQTLEALRKDGTLTTMELPAGYQNLYQDLQRLVTFEELNSWSKLFTESTIEFVAENRDAHHHLAIKKALEFIDAHYNENLSVNKVAEQVYLSPNYFSHIFKKIRGESFTDYLNRVRIQHAKRLLAEKLYKVYEVSDMVGYSDYKYFSSVFKKITGVSPTDYYELLD